METLKILRFLFVKTLKVVWSMFALAVMAAFALQGYTYWQNKRKVESENPYVVVNYIIDKLNEGKGRELDVLVVDKSEYKMTTPTCYALYISQSPDYDSSCSATGGKAYTQHYLDMVPVGLGECVLDAKNTKYNAGGAKGDSMFGRIYCGKTPINFSLRKFVDLGPGERVITDYWVLDPTTLFYGIMLGFESQT